MYTPTPVRLGAFMVGTVAVRAYTRDSARGEGRAALRILAVRVEYACAFREGGVAI